MYKTDPCMFMNQSLLFHHKYCIVYFRRHSLEMNKKDIVHFLEEIALYLEIKGENPFRISAYRKAAQGLERDIRSLNEIDDFTTITGIGKGTNELIVELIETGESSLLTELKAEIPASLLPLLKLPGLGGKRISTLYKELNITDVTSLKQACLDGSILEVRGFGKKTVENILQALETTQERPERLPIHYMLRLAEEIETYLQTIDSITRFSMAGSLRRLSETVKDIDFIIETDDAGDVRDALLKMDRVKEVIAQGDTKISLTLDDEYSVNVDFRLVPKEAYATTLHHFTGSKEHNVSMRQRAKERNEKINEYGVTVEESDETIHFQTEEAFFNHFDLHFIPPELREDTTALETFEKEIELVELTDIRGDLHMHTTWSDGANSLEEMVQAAIKRGYEYIAITDHSKYLQVANGLDEERLLAQREEIDRLNKTYEQIHIFAGVEMDILPNGELDFSDDFLQQMDWVIAAIHSSFNQTEAEIMNRIEAACENKYVDVIAHPTGRLIGRREAYAIDVDRLIDLAAQTNTALELNANPMRFDLAPESLIKAQEKGVPIAINTDAHQIKTLSHMDLGVKVGRKAWLKKEAVMNSWTLDEVKAFARRNHSSLI